MPQDERRGNSYGHATSYSSCLQNLPTARLQRQQLLFGDQAAHKHGGSFLGAAPAPAPAVGRCQGMPQLGSAVRRGHALQRLQAALELSGAAALQEASSVPGVGRPAKRRRRRGGRGSAQRARAEPRQAGQLGLPDAAPARAQRRGRQEDEQSGDAPLRRGVHPSPAAAAGRARRGQRRLPGGAAAATRPPPSAPGCRVGGRGGLRGQRQLVLFRLALVRRPRGQLGARLAALGVLLGRERLRRGAQPGGTGAARLHQLVRDLLTEGHLPASRLLSSNTEHSAV